MLKSLMKFKYLALFTLFATNLVDQPAPEVTIEQGIVSGIISDDGTIYHYAGIPYATVDATNRFQAPLPPPSWSGVFRAVDATTSCPQQSSLGISGIEDCLKINVYVPVESKKPLPVMFYIHGGAFFLGSGGLMVHGPEFLVKNEVILVTFNYRLGSQGFLCLGIKEAPGNAGLKDQLAALKWVRKNIAAFGGDPENITIFGTSAGAVSVSLFLLNESTHSLFNRAIIQSGSSLVPWGINRNPIESASQIAKKLGYNTTDPYELYKIYYNADLKDILPLEGVQNSNLFFDVMLMHSPCVENKLNGIVPFLTDDPYNLIKNISIDKPLIYGTTTGEGLFVSALEKSGNIVKKQNVYEFSSDLDFKSKEEATNASKRVSQFYSGEPISHYTHLFFEMPTLLEAAKIMENGNRNVYNYYFGYSGGRNLVKYLTNFNNESIACHGDDLLYTFKGRMWPFSITVDDHKVIEKFCKIWTNFAKYGEPTPPDQTNSLPSWVPSTKENFTFLHIDKEFKVGPIIDPDAFILWKDLYNKYRRKDLNFSNILSMA